MSFVHVQREWSSQRPRHVNLKLRWKQRWGPSLGHATRTSPLTVNSIAARSSCFAMEESSDFPPTAREVLAAAERTSMPRRPQHVTRNRHQSFTRSTTAWLADKQILRFLIQTCPRYVRFAAKETPEPQRKILSVWRVLLFAGWTNPKTIGNYKYVLYYMNQFD